MSEKMPGLETPKQESTEKSPLNEFEEYEDLITHYERLNAEEAEKEKVECEPHIEEFEAIIEPLLKEELLETLNEIKTKEEAENNAERIATKEVLAPLVKTMRFLKERTDISEEEYEKLHERYKKVSRAVGMINSGMVDHNR